MGSKATKCPSNSEVSVGKTPQPLLGKDSEDDVPEGPRPPGLRSLVGRYIVLTYQTHGRTVTMQPVFKTSVAHVLSAPTDCEQGVHVDTLHLGTAGGTGLPAPRQRADVSSNCQADLRCILPPWDSLNCCLIPAFHLCI